MPKQCVGCHEIETVGAPHIPPSMQLIDAAIEMIKEMEMENKQNLNTLKKQHIEDSIKAQGNHMKTLNQIADNVDKIFNSGDKPESEELPMEKPVLIRQNNIMATPVPKKKSIIEIPERKLLVRKPKTIERMNSSKSLKDTLKKEKPKVNARWK